MDTGVSERGIQLAQVVKEENKKAIQKKLSESYRRRLYNKTTLRSAVLFEEREGSVH